MQEAMYLTPSDTKSKEIKGSERPMISWLFSLCWIFGLIFQHLTFLLVSYYTQVFFPCCIISTICMRNTDPSIFIGFVKYKQEKNQTHTVLEESYIWCAQLWFWIQKLILADGRFLYVSWGSRTIFEPWNIRKLDQKQCNRAVSLHSNCQFQIQTTAGKSIS